MKQHEKVKFIREELRHVTDIDILLKKRKKGNVIKIINLNFIGGSFICPVAELYNLVSIWGNEIHSYYELLNILNKEEISDES